MMKFLNQYNIIHLEKLFIIILISLLTSAIFVIAQHGETSCRTLDSNNSETNGFCINIKSQLKLCQPLHSLLMNKDWGNLRKRICSDDNKRVCCPADSFTEVVTDESSQIGSQDYNTHPNFKLLPSLRGCGLAFHSSGDRIIGGNASSPGEFPWVARIAMQNEDESHPRYICGGSIINKRYILTAAHCFKHDSQKLIHIRIGQSDEEKETECLDLNFGDRRNNGNSRQTPPQTVSPCAKAIDMPFEDIIVHPGYTKEIGSPSDIALIRLAADIDLNSYFTKAICLPFLNEYHVKSQLDENKILRNDKTLVAGFGKTNNEELVGSLSLQFVKSPIQPNIMCRISYPNFNVSHTQICAGGLSGSGSCIGDSGGPLFLPANPERGSRNLRSFQLGIVSFGKTKCAQENEPVVYTKVRSYLNWILDNIRE